MKRRPPPAAAIPEVPRRLRRFSPADWAEVAGGRVESWQFQLAHDHWRAARRGWEAEHGITIHEVWLRLHAAYGGSLEGIGELYAGPLFIDDEHPDPRWSA